MASEGMTNLDQLHYNKVNRRVQEIGERFLWSERAPIRDVAAAETMEHLSASHARQLRYRRVSGGFQWGQPWGSAWFRLRFKVAEALRGETVVLRFRPDGECIIFRDGTPVQALDHGRCDYIVCDRARGGESVELWVEAGANAAFGGFTRRTMQQPESAILNREVWDAYWDLEALLAMIDPLPRPTWLTQRPRHALDLNDTRRARILFALTEAVDLFDYDRPGRADLQRQAREVRRRLAPVYACGASASAQTIACFGHAHIDVAWLWPLAETKRKCARTFSNVVSLMDRYPEFRFVQSQPQLYEYTKDRYPALYRRIVEKVRKGQWIPTGAMWVEADCNVTSGESLVRQILFGTRFFRKELGVQVCDLWLPDVFGYSAALPQLLRRSGIRYFLTQKISWSQFSRFPYHSFWWEGIDGTRLLTHFPPAETYNSALDASELLDATRCYQEKDRSPIQGLPFGYGDGGGGPTPMMLERLRRYRNLEGMPRTVPMTVREFFRRLETESTRLPSWVGELYLEFHRGTYTTQAYNKRFNRLSELQLRDAEILSAFDAAEGGRYDAKRLNEAWKLLLLNQFHDIIPGSSIDEVYRDSDRDYAAILAAAQGVRAGALSRLAGRIDTRGSGTPIVVFNTLSWDREGLVVAPVATLSRRKPYRVRDSRGRLVPAQVGPDGALRFRGSVPSLGHAVFHLEQGRCGGQVVEATERVLENSMVRVEFDAQGGLRRVLDKRVGREVLPAGATGNQFIVFEDKMATCGPAWDMDIFYNDKPLEFGGKLLSAEVVERGPARSVVRFRRRISKSIVTQDVSLAAESPCVEFATAVDWNSDEKDVILKVAFPVHVRADKARYEIQFGTVERPTHWNRPNDFGMFEVPAQRWADLSEADYGVALLNDCKYGHDIRGNVMRLTLLRAPKSPGLTADVGKTHRFTYALFPHAGGFTQGVVRAGYELNVPMAGAQVPARKGSRPPCGSRMRVSGEHGVVIDTIKRAEDDDALIVRLYEAHGCRGRVRLETTLPVRRVVETDLMEREEGPVAIRNGRLELDVKPYQIRTLKLVMARRRA